MYRAYVHFHPHAHNHTKSSVPGAFPSGSMTQSQNTDYSRTFSLTAASPKALIGRSSRNLTKGLHPSKDNGFFESPVMSRNHAEVTMILSPNRKITIRDTDSMHGTFVNGLRLRKNETAELQQGTELTFGAEVTRAEEVFAAKTFRCEVEWQRSPTPPPTPAKPETSRAGYGVSGDDLIVSEYGSEADDDEMYYGGHSDDDKSSETSGRASSPPSSSRSPVIDLTTDSHTSAHSGDKETVEGHAQITSRAKASNTRIYWSTKQPVVERISNARDSKPEQFNVRQRMPTIPSLVNVTDSENDDERPNALKDAVRESASVVCGNGPLNDVPAAAPIFIEDDSDDELSKGPIYINDDDPEDEDTDYEPSNEIPQASDLEDSEPESEPEDSEMSEPSDAEVDEVDEAEVDEPDDEPDEPNELSTDEQNDKQPQDDKENKEPAETHFQSTPSTPLSPPDVLSSKLSASWSGLAAIKKAHESTHSLPPMASTLPIFLQGPTFSIQAASDGVSPISIRTTSGGYHTHWAPDTETSKTSIAALMDSKHDFFSARAHNSKTVAERSSRLAPEPLIAHVDRTHNEPLEDGPPTAGSAENTSKSVDHGDDTFANPRRVSKPLNDLIMDCKQALSVASARDEVKGKSPAKSGDADDAAPYDEDADYESEQADVSESVKAGAKPLQRAEVLDELNDLMDSSMNEAAQLPENPVGEPVYPKLNRRFEIKDILHRAPSEEALQYETLEPSQNDIPCFSSSYFGPPTSENSGTYDGPLEKGKAGSNLEDILNPECSNMAPPTRKRKHSCIDTEIGPQPTSEDSTLATQTQDTMPHAETDAVIADLDADCEKEVAPTSEVQHERPAKRTKRDDGPGFLGIATAAVVGGVMGAAGMFAALVATAQ